eukprot:TRINITY_DN16709_c0_g2_i2.p1 TRINITY_DN16709_c0_g2~~TRINITY_DN16709_c0_g2_i2.p1  ORF type:complete len:553 (+),score=158.09 TRINITY_DN16709_c0_g2_i2:225-1883(+)
MPSDVVLSTPGEDEAEVRPDASEGGEGDQSRLEQSLEQESRWVGLHDPGDEIESSGQETVPEASASDSRQCDTSDAVTAAAEITMEAEPFDTERSSHGVAELAPAESCDGHHKDLEERSLGLVEHDAEQVADSPEDEELHWLRRERSLLLGELGSLKAKFEITLQTLRSILGLELSCSWADIVEHTEALATSVRRRPKAVASQKRGQQDTRQEDDEEGEDDESVEDTAALLLQAEMDLDDKEQQLEATTRQSEERQARIKDLSDVLAKQQDLLDMTSAQLSDQQEQKDTIAKQHQQILQLSSERDRFREEVQKFRETSQLQEQQLREKDGQLNALEGALSKSETSLVRRQQEYEVVQVDCERQRQEIQELETAVALRDEEVAKVRSQLEVHEAAERRRHSYRPNGAGFGCRNTRSTSALLDDGASEHGSSVSSARPSARGPGNRAPSDGVPSTPGDRPHNASSTPSEGLRRPGLRPSPPLVTMDKDERAAFLSHFPMASRTERHLRSRIDDGSRRLRYPHGIGEEGDAPSLESLQVGETMSSPLTSARATNP